MPPYEQEPVYKNSSLGRQRNVMGEDGNRNFQPEEFDDDEEQDKPLGLGIEENIPIGVLANAGHQPKNSSSKSKKKNIIIAGCLILLIIGAVVATVLILRMKSSESNSGEANSNSDPSSSGSDTGKSLLPKDIGNCKSGSFPFQMSRTSLEGYVNGSLLASVDALTHDFIIPYGLANTQMENGKLTMTLRKGADPSQPSSGAALTTTRYMLYGKYTATIKAINRGGPITTFITLSDNGDEIDMEICGKPVSPYTNIFYDSVGKTEEQKEYFGHFETVSGFDMDLPHKYTIDWKRESLAWYIDDKLVRIVYKNSSLSKLNPSGPKWYPTRPSLIQFGIWDASHVPDKRTIEWAGGPLIWNDGETQLLATMEGFQIECYDDKDNPVGEWPLTK